jgi:DNA-binding transcriptional LysR family regulator
MTLQQLRYFVWVSRTGSIRKAARALHVSEPTLSQQLKVLQRELGGRLFERVGGRLQMTELGRRVFEPAKTMLEQEATIRQRTRSKETVLRIGAIPAAIRLLLPQALRFFQHHCPTVTVVIREDGSASVVEAIRDGNLDFGIIATNDVTLPDEGLQRCLLLVSRLVLCEPRSVPRAVRETLPLILLPRGYLLHDALEEYSRYLGCRVIIQAASTESALRFVASGIGFAILPEHMVSGDTAINTRTSPLPLGPGQLGMWRWELVWPERELSVHDRRWIESVRSASSSLATCEATHVPVSLGVNHA